MTSSKGRWYVIGRDVDRDATRMFKLSRITDLPRRESKPGAYEVPADLDLRSLARALAPPEPTEEAVLALRAGRTVRFAPTTPEEFGSGLAAAFGDPDVGRALGEMYTVIGQRGFAPEPAAVEAAFGERQRTIEDALAAVPLAE